MSKQKHISTIPVPTAIARQYSNLARAKMPGLGLRQGAVTKYTAALIALCLEDAELADRVAVRASADLLAPKLVEDDQLEVDLNSAA